MLSEAQRLGLVETELTFSSFDILLSLLALGISALYTNFTRFKNLKIQASHPLHLIAMKTLCNLAVALSRGAIHAWALVDRERRFTQDSQPCIWSNGAQDFFNHASSAWFFVVSPTGLGAATSLLCLFLHANGFIHAC
jgi:hypothetical protein